jgi:hypothetical protein
MIWQKYDRKKFYSTGPCTIEHYGLVIYRKWTYFIVSESFITLGKHASLLRGQILHRISPGIFLRFTLDLGKFNNRGLSVKNLSPLFIFTKWRHDTQQY